MKKLSLINLGTSISQKKQSFVHIATEQPKKTNSFDIFGKSPYNTRIRRSNMKQLVKEFQPITSRAMQRDNIKSPPQTSKASKPISVSNALQKEELKFIDSSRKTIQKTSQYQLKSILSKEQNHLHDHSQKMNTQISTHLIPSSSKQPLKTSPDLKMTFQEQKSTKASFKKSSVINYEKIHLEEKNKQKVLELQQIVKTNIKQRPVKKLEEIPMIKEKTVFPLTAFAALQRFGDQLSDFEKSEIIDYENIYYIPPKSISNEIGSRRDTQFNNGFDTSVGEYIFVKSDQVAYRYEMTEKLGHGSFGQVFEVIDHKHNKPVALKIIRNQEKFYNQALIEIDILKVINRADNSSCLIRMLNYFTFRNHICMVFEKLSCNLYEFIAINNFAGFDLNLIRRFAIQILQSLIFMKEHSIIHCDLKPENILLIDFNRSGIKVIDFGSSCFVNKKMYSYIQSRFYRAPEIVLGLGYSTQIDMWSFGCIVAELFTGQSLFQSKSEKELLYLQIKAIGKPPKEYIDLSTKKSKFFDEFYQLNFKIKESDLLLQTKTLSQHLEGSSNTFQDFIRKCLTWDPQKRITPEEALIHPWIVEGLPTDIRKEHIQQMSRFLKKINPNINVELDELEERNVQESEFL